MLREWRFERTTEPEEVHKAELKQRRADLAGLQQRLKQAGLPVIVLVEGWGAAGKGSVIRSLIRELDPRFFKVISVSMPTEEERRWPFLKRYVQSIPEAGKVLFLDSGWMDETVRERLQGGLSEREYARRLESVRMMERQLAAGGYLLVKLFLHIDRERQRKRLKKLASHKDTAWRAGENDWRQNKNYGRTLDAFQDFMSATDAPWARWKVIDGSHAVRAQLEAADWLYHQICTALDCRPAAEQPKREWPLLPMEPLSQVRLDQALGEKEYRKQLKKCRKELAELHNELYRKKVPVVIVYEGWDAAGKGGNIKRLASALDPRGYEVIPIAAPTHDELARHYLWRFWDCLLYTSSPPFREAEFDIMYGEGISKWGELVDLAVKLDILQKSGSWFSMGETRLGQGRDAVKEYLKNNPELADRIEAEVRANSFKLMSKQSQIAARAAGRAVDVSADDFEDGADGQ